MGGFLQFREAERKVGGSQVVLELLRVFVQGFLFFRKSSFGWQKGKCRIAEVFPFVECKLAIVSMETTSKLINL